MKNICRKIVSSMVIMSFVCTTVLQDAWAFPKVNNFPVERGELTPLSTAINCKTFTIPEHLGEIKGYCEGTSGKTIIQIQDAHCNYYAEKKISEIINYLVEEYGIKIMNLEGGSGEYDLTPFTQISGVEIRKEVSDYFLKKGEINAAEFFTINNPEKLKLWGIENKDLYLKNLKVYRDSLSNKVLTTELLDKLSKNLDKLKLDIYNKELLDIDIHYSRYKSGAEEFKEYLMFLFGRGKELYLKIDKYKNLEYLYDSLLLESDINFHKANKERDSLVDLLKKKLSKNELRELISRLLDYKTRKISRNDFYTYLLAKGKETNIDEKGFKDFIKYSEYIASYENVDRSKVMVEMVEFEQAIKQHFFENSDQEELSRLSKNLSILKNIFSFTLTSDDYEYYEKNIKSFEMQNYIDFIRKHDGEDHHDYLNKIAELDKFRSEIALFFKYSFERDRIFMHNLRFAPEGEDANIPKTGLILTGGFHTDNLCKIFKKNNISYISIMPRFYSGDNFKNPYFELLSGKPTKVARMLSSALAKASTLMIANKLNPTLRDSVYGKNSDIILRSEILIREYVAKGFQVILRKNEEDTSPVIFGNITNGIVDLSAELLIEKVRKGESLEDLIIYKKELSEPPLNNGLKNLNPKQKTVINRAIKLLKQRTISFTAFSRSIILILTFIMMLNPTFGRAETNNIPLFKNLHTTISQTYEYMKLQAKKNINKYRIPADAARDLVSPIEDLSGGDRRICGIANIRESINISNSPEFIDISRKAHNLLIKKKLLKPNDPFAPILFLKGLKRQGLAMAVYTPGLIVVGLDALKDMQKNGADPVEELSIMIPHELKHLRNRIERPNISRLEDEALAFAETAKTLKVFSKDKLQIKAQELVADAFLTIVNKRDENGRRTITRLMGVDSIYDLYYADVNLVFENGKIVAIDIDLFDRTAPQKKIQRVRVKGNMIQVFILKKDMSQIDSDAGLFLVNYNPDLSYDVIFGDNIFAARVSGIDEDDVALMDEETTQNDVTTIYNFIKSYVNWSLFSEATFRLKRFVLRSSVIITLLLTAFIFNIFGSIPIANAHTTMPSGIPSIVKTYIDDIDDNAANLVDVWNQVTGLDGFLMKNQELRDFFDGFKWENPGNIADLDIMNDLKDWIQSKPKMEQQKITDDLVNGFYSYIKIMHKYNPDAQALDSEQATKYRELNCYRSCELLLGFMDYLGLGGKILLTPVRVDYEGRKVEHVCAVELIETPEGKDLRVLDPVYRQINNGVEDINFEFLHELGIMVDGVLQFMPAKDAKQAYRDGALEFTEDEVKSDNKVLINQMSPEIQDSWQKEYDEYYKNGEGDLEKALKSTENRYEYYKIKRHLFQNSASDLFNAERNMTVALVSAATVLYDMGDYEGALKRANTAREHFNEFFVEDTSYPDSIEKDISSINGIDAWISEVDSLAKKKLKDGYSALLTPKLQAVSDTGNIASGLSEQEAKEWEKELIIPKSNVNKSLVKLVKEQVPILTELLELKNFSFSKINKNKFFKELKDNLTSKGMDINEINKIIRKVVKALVFPDSTFKYLKTRVEGREKYLLGSENTLAIDILSFLHDRENDLSLSKGERTDLVAEYIFHEAMENTPLDHWEIIKISSEIFDRPEQTKDSEFPVIIDEIKEGNVGHTPLGIALNDFIDNEISKSENYIEVESLISSILADNDVVSIVEKDKKINELIRGLSETEILYIFENYIYGLYGVSSYYYNDLLDQTNDTGFVIDSLFAEYFERNNDLLPDLFKLLSKLDMDDQLIWGILGTDYFSGKEISDTLGTGNVAFKDIAGLAVDPLNNNANVISEIIEKILLSEEINKTKRKEYAGTILTLITETMNKEGIVSNSVIPLAGIALDLTETDLTKMILTDEGKKARDAKQLYLMNEIFQYVFNVLNDTKTREINYTSLKNDLMSKYADDIKILSQSQKIAMETILLEFFNLKGQAQLKFNKYKEKIAGFNELSKKVEAGDTSLLEELEEARKRIGRYIKDELSIDPKMLKIGNIEMGPFSVEVKTDTNDINKIYEQIHSGQQKQISEDIKFSKKDPPTILFEKLEKVSRDLPNYLYVIYHDEMIATMAMADLRQQDFNTFFDDHIDMYRSRVIEYIIAAAGVSSDDTETIDKISKIIENVINGQPGREFKEKLARTKRTLDRLVDIKASIIYHRLEKETPEQAKDTILKEAYNEASQYVLGIFQMIPLENIEQLEYFEGIFIDELHENNLSEANIFKTLPEPEDFIDNEAGLGIHGFKNKNVLYSSFENSSFIMNHERAHYVFSFMKQYVLRGKAGIQGFINEVQREAIEYSGFIGKLILNDGTVLEKPTNVVENENVVEIYSGKEVVASLPISQNNGRNRIMKKSDVLRQIRDSEEFHYEELSEDMKERLDGMLKRMKNKFSDEIILLDDSTSHPEIKGLFFEGKIYLNQNLIDNPLALLHEIGEGYVALPEGRNYAGMSRHTFMRGVGKDIRNAFISLENENKISPEITPAKLVDLLENKLLQMAVVDGVNISRSRIDQKNNGLEESLMTKSEKALIYYNFDNHKKGKELLYGVQDFLDPNGNLTLTSNIKILTDDLRQDTLNIYLIESGPIESQQAQDTLARETSRKYRKNMGINTHVFHYTDAKSLLEQFDDAIKLSSESKNVNKAPKIFIHTLGEVSKVKSEINNSIENDTSTNKRQKENIYKMLVYGSQKLPKNEKEAKNVKIDDVRIIAIGSAILNDNRLRKDFGLTPERLLENRTRMIKAFIASGIIDGRGISFTSEGLETVMDLLYVGEIPLQISPINWETITEYHDSMKQVLRSL